MPDAGGRGGQNLAGIHCRRNHQSGMIISRTIGGPALLANVVFVPMVVDSIRHLGDPGAVFHLFDQFKRGEELDGVGGWISQWP